MQGIEECEHFAMSSSSLSPVQKQKLTALFRHYDRDGDGQLALSDYLMVAERFAGATGLVAERERTTELMEHRRDAFAALKPGAERVSLEDFLASAATRAAAISAGAAPDVALECPELYALLSKEQFSVLTQTDYTLFLVAMGSDADPAAAFQRLDRDDDGTLILSDLTDLVSEFLTSSVPDAAGNLLFLGK